MKAIMFLQAHTPKCWRPSNHRDISGCWRFLYQDEHTTDHTTIHYPVGSVRSVRHVAFSPFAVTFEALHTCFLQVETLYGRIYSRQGGALVQSLSKAAEAVNIHDWIKLFTPQPVCPVSACVSLCQPVSFSHCEAHTALLSAWDLSLWIPEPPLLTVTSTRRRGSSL